MMENMIVLKLKMKIIRNIIKINIRFKVLKNIDFHLTLGSMNNVPYTFIEQYIENVNNRYNENSKHIFKIYFLNFFSFNNYYYFIYEIL